MSLSSPDKVSNEFTFAGQECPALSTSTFELSTANKTVGSSVNVSCVHFGHRVVGDRFLTCNRTWEFTTHEKVVFGTAVAGVAFIILILIITAITCCCCRRRDREEKMYNDLMYGDNPGFTTAPGDTGPGIYPDAYFAYQDMSEKQNDLNGAAGTLDRPWLGYIPRPKVAEGKYYH
ncbi:hypothetical protein BaRGS_00040546 [Batillaria attramentaria]|uniref:Sushi domain-containing protein n=1 Tax=Batillaria attramentaria TaxID=370345 RepID=A0ABD0J0N3_9CAEN